MATKTYLTHKPSLSLSWPHKDELGNIKDTQLFFTSGKLVTDDADEQKFIESLPIFKDETIYLESAAEVLAVATVKAADLKKIADKAVAEAVDAQKAVDALKAPAKV